ncbi:SMP-30/gluconolactonase/LRE family protein, partial [Parabacteroides sp. OttesenSCG-928-G21]|nr:SMP-30/gluconolactonase/LRE family protein [Parabacteroides sp. OttesenSCG-928-G21]
KPLLETPKGGKNIVNGIGLNTGAYNYRAVGCKWMAGTDSYMNDVKFVGGHGSIYPPQPSTAQQGQQANRARGQQISSPRSPVAAQAKDLAWDNQYWSLWVTDGGGGTFKDIWTASSYAASGLYVNNTSTSGRIYAMSLEHHVRNEARFKNVSNWKMYAFQLEEESREGQYCQPIELENCSNLLFANLYMFQVIRVNTPYPYSIRTWNCKDIEFLNLHNYAQTKYTTTIPLYDINKNIEVRPWEINRLYITGNEPTKNPLTNTVGKVERLATGFEFSEGTTSDSKGNVYFSEQRLRRIYKWSAETNTVSMVADFQWEPLSLGCDSQDNLLVVFKYNAQPGYLINGEPEKIDPLPDTGGTSFAGWGNSGYGVWVYSIDPNNPEETIKLLPKVKMGSISNIHKALYPSNRWRDFHDFNTNVLFKPEYCFVAPDGKTIIPQQFDLARGSSLLEAFPGKPFYASDEYDKRMVKMDVDNQGVLSNLKYFVEMGEFGSTVDSSGNLYVADGQVYIFNPEGKRIGEYEIPERPLTMHFGGSDKNTLFVNSYKSLFRVKVK